MNSIEYLRNNNNPSQTQGKKIKRRGKNTSKLFYVVSITLIPKPDRHHKMRKQQIIIPYEYRGKNPPQNISKLNPTTY